MTMTTAATVPVRMNVTMRIRSRAPMVATIRAGAPTGTTSVNGFAYGSVAAPSAGLAPIAIGPYSAGVGIVPVPADAKAGLPAPVTDGSTVVTSGQTCTVYPAGVAAGASAEMRAASPLRRMSRGDTS